jgi:hypothetical protein
MANMTNGSGLTNRDSQSKGCGRSWTGWLTLIAFFALGGYLLAGEHRVHVLAALPFLFFLACPLMHLFMHHGGGSNAGGPTR